MLRNTIIVVKSRQWRRDGLVELRPDKDNRRAKRDTLTPAGIALLDKAPQYWLIANQRVGTVLSKESAETLRSLAEYPASDKFLYAIQSETFCTNRRIVMFCLENSDFHCCSYNQKLGRYVDKRPP